MIIASPLPGATYLAQTLPADHAMTVLLPPVPIPADDALRVEAVRRLGVLDTEPEAEFDDIAWLAAHITGAPMALVSLLDADRQWFKARCGTDLEGTPRAMSFCSYTVMGTELLEVPDAAADPRFARNPLVTAAPGVRSYAGVPLVGREGYAYGAQHQIAAARRKPEARPDPPGAASRRSTGGASRPVGCAGAAADPEPFAGSHARRRGVLRQRRAAA
ncbi:hypothetical protein FHY34_002250 [Xanthomonas arboricola]|nr:hypothetical protein [Xanthomonas arboricola]